MSQEQAKAWLPLIQAVAEGKTLQSSLIEHDDGTFKKVWRDCNLPENMMRVDTKYFRIKPREFKNFSLPWEFIEKRWNYATYSICDSGATLGVILYESRPTFRDKETINGVMIREGWTSKGGSCTWTNLIPTQQGINETEWLACRNEFELPEGDA